MSLRCLFGHRWLLNRLDVTRHFLMAHYNTNAGMDLECEKCGKILADAGEHGTCVDPPMRLWGPEYRARVKATIKELNL